MPAQRIRFYRKAKGLTQRELAEAMGVTATTVWLWEDGRRSPTYETLIRIQEFLGVPRTLFFTEGLDGTRSKG